MEQGGRAVGSIQSHEELDVYSMAFDAAMRIYEETKKFPREETYSLTDQIRRSARSVCSNIAEAWRKRRYEAAFVNKLNDAESEAAVPWLRLREAPPRGGMLRENPNLAQVRTQLQLSTVRNGG